MYKCGSCGKNAELGSGGPIRCPSCGYKILFKERPQIVKKVKSR
jgi:DNA-directed RNA polymerase subunit RPC12/RpoP